jgi:arsenite methyltransferase
MTRRSEEKVAAAVFHNGFDIDRLRHLICAEYDRVARKPQRHFHFHRGLDYAARVLRYDPQELSAIPEESAAAFTGVGNPHRIGPIRQGETVLDIGCGAGMDLILAVQRTVAGGLAIGVDMTPAMIERAKRAAIKAGVWASMDVRRGIAEELPVENASIDVVISNGVLNLCPNKLAVFAEIYRVLKPGGRLYLADVIVQRGLSLAERSNIDLWTAGIGGAPQEAELYEIAFGTGLVDGRIVERFDCFEGTSAKAKLSQDLGVEGVNFFAHKPERPSEAAPNVRT